MMLRNYASMNSLSYHEKQLEYNMTNLLASIMKAYPEDQNPDLSNPAYKDFLANNAFNPAMIGGLADTLGLKDKVLTTELWRDLANGYCPVTESSPLYSQAIDTPRGKMVQFRKSSTTILPDGTYEKQREGDKKTRLGTEFIFCFGERFSTALSLMATENPQVELEFKKLCMDVFNEQIMPEMINMARIRKGADGVDYEMASEILAVPFLHSENRAEQSFYHFHFDLLNVARGLDDELYSLCTDEIGANVSALDALFMSHMKEKLEANFGFVFEEVKHKDDIANEFIEHNSKKTVSFDLPESLIPANVLEYRSKREKEMEKALKESGKSGPEAMELARHASRDDKTDKSPGELLAQWKQDYKELGWSVDQFKKNLAQFKQSYKPNLDIPSAEVVEDSFIRNHKEIAFTEYQYVAHIRKQLLPYMSREQAERQASEIFERDCQLSLDKEQMEYFKPLLDDTIEDPTLRNSMQLRFLREAKFLHTTTIENDKYIASSLKARELEEGFIFDKSLVAKYIQDFQAKNSNGKKPFIFAKGQSDAIKMILTDKGAVCNVSGRAGAGKSTLLKVAVDYYKEQGYNIYGTSTASSATLNLAKDTGMNSGEFNNTTQLLRLLDDGKVKFNSKTILFWDEAGMADSKTFYRLIKHVNEAGGKIVLSGEKEQIQPVGAGGSFKFLGENFVTTKVNEINRQVDNWQREMVENFASGKSNKAIRELNDNGRVTITQTEKQRLERIVDDYLDSKEQVYSGTVSFKYLDINGVEKIYSSDSLSFTERIPKKDKATGEVTYLEKEKTYSNAELLKLAQSKKKWDKDYIIQGIERAIGDKVSKVLDVQDKLKTEKKAVAFTDKIIIASTNDDVDKINDRIREKLKLSEKIGKDDVFVQGKDGSERAFSVGDRIIFTKTQKSDDPSKAKILNADQGEVKSFIYGKDGQVKAMSLVMTDGKEVSLDLSKKHSIKPSYATSIHKSQGQTKISSFFYVSNTMNSLHSAYVACSRHRKNLSMYLSEDMVSNLEQKMDGKGPTASMKKVAEWIAKENKIELTPETLQSFQDTRAFLNKHHKAIDGTEGNPLDRFTSLIEAMSKTQFKKTSNDYEILDGKAKNTYESLKVAVVEKLRNYKTRVQEVPEAIKAQLIERQRLAKEAQQQKSKKSLRI